MSITKTKDTLQVLKENILIRDLKGRYTLDDMTLQHVTNVAATRRGGKPLLVYRLGDKLLQQLMATRRSDVVPSFLYFFFVFR